LPAQSEASLQSSSLNSHGAQALINEAHENRLDIQETMQSRTQTANNYDRYIKRYHVWWAEDQERRKRADPMWQAIPAEPLNWSKASVFLQYESTRPK
ncbi:hypothetical protein EV360DRAFT_22979, partial [Lentinula raphanica]